MLRGITIGVLAAVLYGGITWLIAGAAQDVGGWVHQAVSTEVGLAVSAFIISALYIVFGSDEIDDAIVFAAASALFMLASGWALVVGHTLVAAGDAIRVIAGGISMFVSGLWFLAGAVLFVRLAVGLARAIARRLP